MNLTKPEREAAEEMRAMLRGIRTIPDSKLKPRRAQNEGSLELEQVEAKESKLF